ncbi:Phycobilisome degradation protein nblA [Synechococcus sp. PCC 7335]|uniref:NblA/ycf18 family protein n=1 Tax=Synechococcus sp. (strain ATCC 29403 / PCC 7335) TaxID=91464 RepID=UPI00017EB836|nr:NblA/ycf18 family protein [Synechococcus sp. PCC 7335]EDX86217.1 Phycobilisome degradation protein nblA [Synechococcus sp. PCC 7335]
MNILGQLNLEQEQELQRVKDKTQDLSLEQTQSYLVELMRQIIVRDNLINHLLTVTNVPQEQYSRSILLQSKSS